MEKVIQFQLHIVFQVCAMNCVAYLINAEFRAEGVRAQFLCNLLLMN